MSNENNSKKTGVFGIPVWDYDKWFFGIFFISSLCVSFYFSHLSKGWEKPIFNEVSISANQQPLNLNYSEKNDTLIISNGIPSENLTVSCFTVERELCGRGDTPYALNYEVEYMNLAQIEGVKYIDKITYVVNKSDVFELQTNLRSYAQDRITGFANKQTLYVGVIGILAAFYIAFRFFGFKFRNNKD